MLFVGPVTNLNEGFINIESENQNSSEFETHCKCLMPFRCLYRSNLLSIWFHYTITGQTWSKINNTKKNKNREKCCQICQIVVNCWHVGPLFKIHLQHIILIFAAYYTILMVSRYVGIMFSSFRFSSLLSN